MWCAARVIRKITLFCSINRLSECRQGKAGSDILITIMTLQYQSDHNTKNLKIAFFLINVQHVTVEIEYEDEGCKMSDNKGEGSVE